ncbi:MAG: ATP-grasp domain-containing protein [Gemmataceae bacterium]
MRLAILARGAGWHVQDLLRAAADRQWSAKVHDFRTMAVGLPGWEPEADCWLVRTMPAGSLEQIVFRMDLLHAAAGRGVRVLNPPRAVETCVDKHLTDVRLAAAGLPVPRTIVCQKAEQALAGFQSLGEDVVVKPLFGSEGRGLVRVSDKELAWRTFHTLEQTGCVIYQQEFIPHAGRDRRLFVLQGRVIAAMERHHPTDWRTNIAQGGTGTAITPNMTEVELALAAAMATGCDVAGVDLLYDRSGKLFVLEVNAVPGWRALSTVVQMDVAGAILDSLAEGQS